MELIELTKKANEIVDKANERMEAGFPNQTKMHLIDLLDLLFEERIDISLNERKLDELKTGEPEPGPELEQKSEKNDNGSGLH